MVMNKNYPQLLICRGRDDQRSRFWTIITIAGFFEVSTISTTSLALAPWDVFQDSSFCCLERVVKNSMLSTSYKVRHDSSNCEMPE